jgi:hypothetical protein
MSDYEEQVFRDLIAFVTGETVRVWQATGHWSAGCGRIIGTGKTAESALASLGENVLREKG